MSSIPDSARPTEHPGCGCTPATPTPAQYEARIDYLLGELLTVADWCSNQLGIDPNDELARRHYQRRAATRPGTDPAVDALRARGRGER